MVSCGAHRRAGGGGRRFTLPAASGKVTPMSKLSLDRILQSQGFGTRKYCRSLIEDGDVVIDGVTQTNYRTTVETEGLVLHVFEEEWVYRAHLYLALNNDPEF